jgi:tetratricopeptide (TPR) repeat protein
MGTLRLTRSMVWGLTLPVLIAGTIGIGAGGPAVLGQLQVLPAAVPLRDPSPRLDAVPVSAPHRETAAGAPAASRPYQPLLDDVRPSSFNSITPGQTQASELKGRLGEPLHQEHEGNEALQSYRIGPFPRVDITLRSGMVVAIVVQLPSALPVAQVEGELGLQSFTPVVLRNELGERLGIAYPERGVMLTLEPGEESTVVMHLVLEVINAESFVRRAESDREHQWEKQLLDLEYAAKVDPTNAEVHACLSEVLAAAGRHSEALNAIDRALKLNSSAPISRVKRAAALGNLGRGNEAIEELQQLLREKSTPLVGALAYYQLGALLAAPPQQNYAQSLKQRMTAVQLATPLASEKTVALRQQSRMLLVQAYLGIAQDIASGEWRDKPAAMGKWLQGAGEIADAMIRDDGGDESLRFLVVRETVAAHANIEEVPLDTHVDEAIAMGERLAAAATDAEYQLSLKREFAKLLFDAARISLGNQDRDRARALAQRSAALCDEVLIQEELTPRQEAWIGRLQFYLGSTCAVQDENHREAVRWYERALPFLTRTAATIPCRQLGEHGERLVSMGVSYWGAGARNEALRLTNEGLEAMLETHRAGQLERRALVVPYANLASMYKLVGKPAEARKMSVLAAKMEGADNSSAN